MAVQSEVYCRRRAAVDQKAGMAARRRERQWSTLGIRIQCRKWAGSGRWPNGGNAQDCVEKLGLIGAPSADSLPWAQEIRPMMGERRVMQEALFYGFSLERHVPDDHLLRKIDRFVDLSALRSYLGPYYSETGRPSIDPELMMRMLIVGYCFGIRSERRLMRRGPPQPGLSLVLSIGAQRRRPRSFDVFQEPPRPVSRERSPSQAVRDRGGALHQGKDRRGRSVRGRREP
jgi:hypothetical protein